MAYVPIVTPPSSTPPSRRTRELAGLLAQVLEEYTKAHPDTSRNEVRAAMRMAQMSAGPDRGNVAVLLSLSLGIGVAALMAGLLFFRGQGGGLELDSSFPMIAVALFIFLFVVVLALVKASR